jgi:antirestriction protein ArdC
MLNNPTNNLQPWQVVQRLNRLFEPYNVGSAYGTQRAEKNGGSETVVYGLSARSKNHANGAEVVRALNDAHRDAITTTANVAGFTKKQLLAAWIRAEFSYTPDAAEIAAALLCDALHIDGHEKVTAGSWPYWSWRDLKEDPDRVADIISAAALLADDDGSLLVPMGGRS